MVHSHMTLASGEHIVRQCNYRVVSGKKYERVESYILTDRRLVSRASEQNKDCFTVDAYEIPIDEIDTVKTFYRNEKKPVSIGLIAAVVLFVIGAIALFVTEQEFFGGIALAVAAIVLIIGLLCRKTQFAFSLDVGRLMGKDVSEHMTTGAVTVKPVRVFGGGASKRSDKIAVVTVLKILQAFALFAAIGMIVVGVLSSVGVLGIDLAFDFLFELFGDLPHGFYTTVSVLVPLVICLALCAVFGLTAKRFDDRQNSKTKSKRTKAHSSTTSALKAEIASDEIILFLDEVGALIENNKKHAAKNADKTN